VEEVLTSLLQSAKNEANATARSCTAEALRDSIAACYEASSEASDGSRFKFMVVPDLTFCTLFTRGVLQLCSESLTRRSGLLSGQGSAASKSRRSKATDRNERFEEEDLESASAEAVEEVREEEEVLAYLTDAIGGMIKLHGEAFMSTFDSAVAPSFAPFLHPRQPQSLQAIAVCLLDDAIEFGGSLAHKYIASLLPQLIENTKATHLVLRQSSTYGIAMAIVAAPQIICEDLPRVLACLHSVLHSNCAKKGEDEEECDEEDEEDENCGTIENAIFAVGTLCADPRYRDAVDAIRAAGVDRAELASQWLRRLPLKQDEQEAKTACKQLCDCLEASDSAVCGAGMSNLPEILRVFAEVFRICSCDAILSEDCAAVAHPETLQRMVSLVQRMLQSPAMGEKAMAALQSLNPQLQQVLTQVAAQA
jgi:hypothetical protein